MTVNQIRKKFTDFFVAKGHVRIPSSPLVPENDPTTLFTGSGMQPLVPYLLGESHPLGTRLVDAQKCFRAQDIEEVGDNRHTTFFEMLGNWSLGDYFKREQIPWMFEFLTKELGLDPSRLYVTVFAGNESIGIPRDDESVMLWQECFASVGITARAVADAESNGMNDGRIFYYPEKKNWWSRAGVPSDMPVGEPGGPDSEMFWDFGAHLKLHETSPWRDQPCHVNCDCGRFVEIGNNVFMEYVRAQKGFQKLKNKNVDFGGGLERMAAALRDNPDVFLIDVFDESRAVLRDLSGKEYGADEATTRAYRVILDHLRAATFLIADGAAPSNKDQGYFTRRLIRRAIRYAHQLGITETFAGRVGAAYIAVYGDEYTALRAQHISIIDALTAEEGKFKLTLAKGLKEFEKLAVIDGKVAFDLYQTYGFPLELTEELAQEKGKMVNHVEFAAEFKKHQDLSRTASAGKFKGGLADDSAMSRKYHTATHLLHKALKMVLGEHIEQKGSNITAERMRFDFSHPAKMTPEEIKRTEDIVNEQISRNLIMSWKEMTLDEARASGAIGLFEEKYGDKVKVYSLGDFSKEICGGPHVESTAGMGHFKIVKEEAVAAGVRRIKAVLE